MACIMVVDDEDSVVHMLNYVLSRLGHAVIAAQDGAQALELLQGTKPDLVILDVKMPKVDGLQLCRYIRANPRLASLPVLMFSVKGLPEERIAGLEAGADDYLVKPCNLIELELRVKALLRRAEQAALDRLLHIGPLRLDPERHQASLAGKPLKLTPVEFELLHYMALHAGEVLSAERLLQEVWAYPPGTGNPSLVRMHVLNLRRKLEADPRHPCYLRTVPRHGYILCLPTGSRGFTHLSQAGQRNKL